MSSNYPNMSYCQCQNTLAALEQVMDTIDDEGREFLPNLSRDERHAFEMLAIICRQFQLRAERMLDSEEVPEEVDN